jgi:hypothetical protein
MKKFFASLVVMVLFCCNASASTVVFNPPAGFTGGSVNGFTFGDNWYNNGRSSQPYMEFYDQNHSITFDAGTFTFTGMSLSATPWDGYGFGAGNLNFDFKDSAGSIIASNSIVLAGGDGFVSFNQMVAGVHEIYFHATGGFWPRLASIDVGAAAVPEPESIALLLTGLGLIGFMSRRRR